MALMHANYKNASKRKSANNFSSIIWCAISAKCNVILKTDVTELSLQESLGLHKD